MKKRIRFIINPISGVAKKDKVPKLIERFLDKDQFEYEIVFTEYRKHAKNIAYQASLEGFDVVCAVGGDGSVHEVGTALIGTQTKLAIIPLGSGNGLARHLNLPLRVKDAIETINNFHFLKMDTVLANDKPFLGVGGYGFDAEIAQKFDQYHIRGFWGYTRLVFKEYSRFKPINVSIKLDGNETFSARVVLCSIANTSEFGNGFCLSPNSIMDDGYLELCLVKPFSRIQLPRIIHQFFNKTSHQSKFTQINRFKKARILIDGSLAHYDGEPFKVRNEINIEVKPKSIFVITIKK
jgi:diacylglycerol kinase family enzyme